MVLTKTPICNFGEKTKSFELKGTDGQLHKLEDHIGKNGLLIMFICNHCPNCLLYTSPSPRDLSTSRMPSSA